MNILQIHPNDTVAVALSPTEAGELLNGIPAQAIAPGHKIALTAIAAGENIVKYGVPIGRATEDIAPGQWVHTHNMRTNLSEESAYAYHPAFHEVEPVPPETFMGYRRSDGRAAIRNEIWILPTVGCVNGAAKALEREGQRLTGGSLEGIYAYTHPFGCSQMGGDHAATRRLLSSLAKHPNAAGVLVLSLGCENLTQEQFQQELGEYDSKRVKFLTCQQVEDEQAAAMELLEELADYAKTFHRQPIPVSELIVGMKCGGSDGLSGITANPVVGAFSDMLIARGGSTVLTEVPEMFGAEDMLLCRCRSEEVFRKAANMLTDFKDYYTAHGQVVYENPSPGNKEGGITTLEDKSCGCVQKGGSAPVEDVIGYGERLQKPGLTLLSGPGNDLVSATALTAAGAHLILFTTGRGTPFGAPAPTLKLSTNTPLFEKKGRWMDFNAGTVAEGERIPDAAERLFAQVLETASGALTKNEESGFREISIFKDGVVL